MRRRVANPIAAMVVDLTIVRLFFRTSISIILFALARARTHEAHFAVYTAIQENSFQNRQQRFYDKGGLRNNVLPLVAKQEI
jgi:hypothetical protein